MEINMSPQLHFVAPSLALKNEILTFRHEYNAVCAELHGANELNAFTDKGFSGWLNYLNAPSGSRWFDYEKVADSTYVALENGVVVGIMNLRHTLNENLLQYGGHIGYSTHPQHQGRGIASAMLAFGLQRLADLGVSRVLVTCRDDNLASARVIEKNGGILTETVSFPDYRLRKYWIECQPNQ